MEAKLSYYIGKAEGLSLYTQSCILRSGFLRVFTIAYLRRQLALMMGWLWTLGFMLPSLYIPGPWI
jgi:hypothetical protein